MPNNSAPLYRPHDVPHLKLGAMTRFVYMSGIWGSTPHDQLPSDNKIDDAADRIIDEAGCDSGVFDIEDIDWSLDAQCENVQYILNRAKARIDAAGSKTLYLFTGRFGIPRLSDLGEAAGMANTNRLLSYFGPHLDGVAFTCYLGSPSNSKSFAKSRIALQIADLQRAADLLGYAHLDWVPVLSHRYSGGGGGFDGDPLSKAQWETCCCMAFTRGDRVIWWDNSSETYNPADHWQQTAAGIFGGRLPAAV